MNNLRGSAFDSFDEINTENETPANPEKQWSLQTDMKIGFAGQWNSAQLVIEGNTFTAHVKQQHDELKETLNIKKIKNSEIIKDADKISIHNPPKSSLPIIVIEYVDKSLYLMPEGGLSYCTLIKMSIEGWRTTDKNSLLNQQLTIDDIPVIVDKCLKFITTQGSLTQGIYRIAGINRQIMALLQEFRRNSWAVNLNPSQYTEHDVANVLKRFFRKLDNPLLTKDLRSLWIGNASIEDADYKLGEYRKLLLRLPEINYKTLRRLIVHLRAISEQSQHNLMPVSNLAALWGPTILTVDGMTGFDFSETAVEVQVISDLTDHFYDLFNVNEQDVIRENNLIRVCKDQQIRENLEDMDNLPQHIRRPSTGAGDIKVLKINILTRFAITSCAFCLILAVYNTSF